MSSRYSHPDQFTEESFDKDISQLLDDLVQDSDSRESEGEFDELANLFEQNLSDSLEDKNHKPPIERVTLTSLPSEDEINDLFNDDFTWEEDGNDWDDTSEEKESSSSLEQSTEQGETDEEFFSDLASAFDEFTQDDDSEEIDDLFGKVESDDNSAVKFKGKVSVISEVYPPLETLASLIEEPATDPSEDVLDAATVAELTALIDAPPVVEEIPLSSSPATPTDIKLLSEGTELDLDEDFQDLEALLEQADRTMGGSPTIVPSPGKRFSGPSPARTTKTKAFEQTMRVPIKQLDNLSNLIGELVVK
ncbi:MAG: hybrid sensor histidine kinase/response regulator, partial [Crocosphaera sp.]